MAKIEKIDFEKAQKILEEVKNRPRGAWSQLISDVKKSGGSVIVSDITRGQAWALKRAAVNAGVKAAVLDGGRKVLLMP
jgi:hypothetical protein